MKTLVNYICEIDSNNIKSLYMGDITYIPSIGDSIGVSTNEINNSFIVEKILHYIKYDKNEDIYVNELTIYLINEDKFIDINTNKNEYMSFNKELFNDKNQLESCRNSLLNIQYLIGIISNDTILGETIRRIYNNE